MSSTTIGLDFGTTNTVVSVRKNNSVTTLKFRTRHGESSTIRTVLALWQDVNSSAITSAVGRDALAEFTEFPEDTRLIQSLKSYAANGLFRQSMIYGKPYTFAALMQLFLSKVFALTDIDISRDVTKIVVGRPVKFAGYSPDAELALSRYREALGALGLTDVSFVQEPVAAALAFAQQLQKDATVLIGDFGGGTTDFSILRLDASSGHARHKVLGVGGIGIAGDQFDYRIMDKVVLPLVGKGTEYKSIGKILELPKHAFDSMARWNELSFLRHSKQYRELQELADSSLAPNKLDRLFAIVDNSRGLSLYDAIAKVKQHLSMHENAMLLYPGLGHDQGIPITRSDFEAWIAGDLQRIDTALATTLDSTKLKPENIDAIFLTGGTSLVPAVRQLFATRFGEAKLNGGDELVSVAKGLIEAGTLST
jgi:hypothetical chaperone protein